MKILLAVVGRSETERAIVERMAACAPPPPGVSVTTRPVSARWPRGRLRFADLDVCWRRREPELMAAYERLYDAARSCDVLLAANGWNLHPEFVRLLPTFNVFCFFDDPESSDKHSRHAAPAYDAVFYGNVASATQYASWGCKRAAHMPIFVDPAWLPPPPETPETPGGIEPTPARPRDNDLVFCGGATDWRKRRLERLAAAFPRARCHGAGWPAGRLGDRAMLDLYARSKIGWNVHNSTGPINQRLFMLAAWGALPICDNRTGLAELFELNKEAVGFDTIPEAIELTRHYLAHDGERAAIARAACARFWRDYHPAPVWRKVVRQIEAWRAEGKIEPHRSAAPAPIELTSPIAATRAARAIASRVELRSRRQFAKAAAALARLRYARPADELDDRLYLGERVPYVPSRPVRGERLLRAARRRVDPADPHHLDALLWALTALLGESETIRVEGDADGGLARLVRRVPGRRLVSGDEPCDVRVLLASATAGMEPAGFAAALSEASRVLAVIHPRREPALGADALFRRLSDGSRSVAFYFMPDPYVPWLEPIEGDVRISPVVAEVRRV